MEQPTPTNGISRIDLSDVPEALEGLTSEVQALKTEVKTGFEALHAKDAEHDQKLQALAGAVAKKVTIPVAAIAIVAEVIKVLASYFGGH